jgi:hypothetical protein
MTAPGLPMTPLVPESSLLLIVHVAKVFRPASELGSLGNSHSQTRLLPVDPRLDPPSSSFWRAHSRSPQGQPPNDLRNHGPRFQTVALQLPLQPTLASPSKDRSPEATVERDRAQPQKFVDLFEERLHYPPMWTIRCMHLLSIVAVQSLAGCSERTGPGPSCRALLETIRESCLGTGSLRMSADTCVQFEAFSQRQWPQAEWDAAEPGCEAENRSLKDPPLLKVDQTRPGDVPSERWQSAMTYRFAGALEVFAGQDAGTTPE